MENLVIDGRNYLAEMDEAIETALPPTDFVNAIVAREVVGKLRANDPELLAGWLDLRAEVILTDFLHHRMKNRRSLSPEARKRHVFGEAAAEFGETGDAERFRTVTHELFDQFLVVGSDNLRRCIGDMTGADHLFVAEGHAETRQAAELLESFHRAVAKKVGNKRTRDVFTESEYRAMYRSVTRREID
jgi:hypothetical protein